ncbi:hybrid sensor histidine kinase/response regulator transcription factor [Anditalea andensis]|uniref:histidine kinase n=1 Tax=Anditalea andensis TaxID=1048983 RepID=A0A074KZZ8_9BACT|nr:hybrid sensor histidine kinase/response regulator transcription factor [Anditalea andensis]KEO73800.1 hypothetical protein EL17_09835 [Anditalea andensis]
MLNLIMVKYFLFLNSICFALLSFGVYGEQSPYDTDPYRFTKLGTKNGLSHNQVNSFLKDKTGFLWIGTASGLNRFDGYHVKVYKHDPADTTTINSNAIKQLFLDPADNLWVKTLDGLNVYDARLEQFSENLTPFLDPYKLIDHELEEIIADDSGQFWFLHKNGGLSRYDPEHHKTDNFIIPSDSDGGVSHIVRDMNGHKWVIYTNGVLEKRDGASMQILFRDYSINALFSEEYFSYKLLADRDGDIWIYLPDERRGVFYFNAKENKIHHIHKESKGHRLNSDLVSAVIEDEDGNIWIGTDHGGINLLDKSNFGVRHIMQDNENPNSLSQNSIYALHKDQEGIIWVGTYKNGLNYFHKNNIRFTHYRHHKSRKESLPFNDINRFVEDKYGNLWIGTNGGGLIFMDRGNQKFTQFTQQNSHGLSSDVVVSLLYDSHDRLWVGTYFGGLIRYDGKQFSPITRDGPGLLDENIWELFEDSKGNIWIGTLSNGIYYLQGGSTQFSDPPIKDGHSMLNASYVAAIEEDREGRIWVGGTSGVDIINPQSGSVMHFSHEIHKNKSLVHDNVLSILHDHKGNMWIGTQGGLSLYDSRNQCFKNFTDRDGLPHSTVLTLLENEGQIWMSTPNGLASLKYNNDDEYEILRYNELDGLQDNAFNENAAYKTKKGEMIFGGPNGFNIFDPKLLVTNKNSPAVVFTDFQLFNKSLSVGKEINGRAILESSLQNTEKITLKHFENVFSVSFAALNFFHPEKNMYKYKLEGFDTEWITLDGNNRQVTYTNLDPGSYALQVLAANNDGVWSAVPAQLNITVLAPFWLTPTAYFVYFVMIIGMLYMSRRWLLIKAKNRFLIEQERRESRQLHELDLMKIRFLTNISHEFRTPLSLIMAPIEKILKEPNNDRQKFQFQMIHRNARRLLHLVNQLLDFRKIEVEGLELHLSKGNIIKFLKEAVYSFNELSQNKAISLSFQSDTESLIAFFDIDKLEKILFNLLSNAFKFTPEGGEITVAVFCRNIPEDDEKSELTIWVKDTGIGIPKDRQAQIFERFYTHEVPDSMVNQGSGIGLSITKEFVRLHGGNIQLESTPGEGSTFKISIPLKTVEKGLANNTSELTGIVRETTDKPATDTGSNDVNLQKLTVLLIEDNDDFRLYLKTGLEEFFEVLEAKNGKEGWKIALAGMPALIVSDLMMPIMNGIALCKKIKNDPRTAHIPVILLTAFTGEDQKLEGLHIGANDYVTKPFNFDLLLSRINNLIKQNQLLQQKYEKKVSIQTSQAEITSMDDKLIVKVMKIVEENFSDPDFSVEFLSREMGMSRVHLYNKLSTLTGKTPIEFIRCMRLQRSLQYLQKSQLSVSEVAYKVGFNNAKTFTKYFKAAYNMIPSAYAAAEKKTPMS